MIARLAGWLIAPPALILLLLLIKAPYPAATASPDFYLPVEHHGARWEWRDLWPKLLHIRRQFDRDGFLRQLPDGGVRHGEI